MGGILSGGPDLNCAPTRRLTTLNHTTALIASTSVVEFEVRAAHGGRQPISKISCRVSTPSIEDSARCERSLTSSRTYLKKAGLLESTRRGYPKIIHRGLTALKQHPREINVDYLEQFPESVDFRFLRKEPDVGSDEREPRPTRLRKRH
jgi:restriction endonuclease Mrr